MAQQERTEQVPAALAVGGEPRSRAPRLGVSLVLRVLRNVPVVPLAIILLLVVIPAVAAPWIAPHDPTAGSVGGRLKPPVWAEGGTSDHLLGTDSGGRDVLSRIIYGGRIEFQIATLAVFLSVLIGTSLGAIAGYYGGVLDAIIARSIDIALSIPVLLFALVLAVTLGPGMRTLLITLILLFWAGSARLIRGETLSLRSHAFVDLARVAGLSGPHIIAKHIVPNIIGTLTVIATLQMSAVVLIEAGLSFLGIGLAHPTPAWGLMVADGRTRLTDAWWLWAFPGLAIFLLVLALNLTGDWVRDRLDPRLDLSR